MKTIKTGPAGADVRLSSAVSQRYEPDTKYIVTEYFKNDFLITTYGAFIDG